MDFEKKIEKIEKILADMESGESLENSLKKFEEGVKLIKECQQDIRKAELRVKTVLGVDPDGQPETE